MGINEILNTFFPELKDTLEYQLLPEREAQYRNIFSDAEMEMFYALYSKSDLRIDKLSSNYMTGILNKLIEHNNVFASQKGHVNIEFINSTDNSTCCFLYEGNTVVLFDRNVMNLYWMLDKTFLYGADLSKNEQTFLYTKILLHFLVKQLGLGNYPRPATPAHKNREGLSNLAITIEIQEAFMLAHEMAHIILDKNDAKRNNISFVNKNLSFLGITIEDDIKDSVCQELEADKIAFECLLNTYVKRTDIFKAGILNIEEEIFKIVSSAIFLLFRYNLWMNIARHELIKDEDPFYMWFVRNSFFRHLVDKMYVWGCAVYIIEILDELEQSFEHATLIAYDVIKRAMEPDYSNYG